MVPAGACRLQGLYSETLRLPHFWYNIFHMLSYQSSRRARIRNGGYRKRGFGGVILYSKLFRLLLLGLVLAIIGFFLYAAWVSRDLPTPGKLSSPEVQDSTKIVDSDGDILYSIFKDYNRIYVDLDKIPKALQEATIATEDKDFYTNQGFSFWAYGRVFKDVLVEGRLTGGSGITQQLVKNVLLTNEFSFTRKLKELILAIQVDKRYSKEEILELYLNNVPYGGTAVGVEAASNLYFNKSVEELDLAESAFLAGLPQSPSYYSPFVGGGDAYIGRSEDVLRRMVEDDYITQEEADKALKKIQRFKFTQKQGNLKAPHFVMYVRQKLADTFGEAAVESGNLIVETTLDYDVQKEAEKIVDEEIEELEDYDVGNGSAIVLDAKTGAILSMVGSRNYFDDKNDGNFNASTSMRQPGSVLKPVMYAAALERGFTPATLLMDVPTEFYNGEGQAMYKPVNYDGKYKGPVQMRFALGNSLNIPAVKLLAMVGIAPVMQLAYDMGITNWEPTQANIQNVGLSLVLGGREASLLQIASAYQVFANEGVKMEPYAIQKVTDKNGKVLYEHKKSKGEEVLSPETAYLISHMLLDNNARKDVFGTNSYLVIPGRTVAAKTGTTDEKRDNWTAGYTPSYVVAVWVGNNDNSKMNPAIASGVTGATPIWNKIMQKVLKDKDEDFKKPDDVVAVEIDSYGGGLPKDGQPTRSEFFVKGTEPSGTASIYKQLKISKAQNDKLANDKEVEKGEYDVKEFVLFAEDDPLSTDGKNRWQDGISAWVGENYKDNPLYKAPSETSSHQP